MPVTDVEIGQRVRIVGLNVEGVVEPDDQQPGRVGAIRRTFIGIRLDTPIAGHEVIWMPHAALEVVDADAH